MSAVTKMRLGLVTPVLTLLPRAHARWEEDGDIDDVARIVVAADALGYHHVTCSEHIAIPTDVAKVRGGRYWDPLATFGYLAAKTTQIRFATYVLVLGYHHPLAIAKRYGTLDRITRRPARPGRRGRVAGSRVRPVRRAVRGSWCARRRRSAGASRGAVGVSSDLPGQPLCVR